MKRQSPSATPANTDVEERQRLAFEMHLAGYTYDEIAKQHGYASHSGAYKAVSTWMEKTRVRPTQELVQIEVARLEVLHKALWPRACAGELKAGTLLLRLMERRAKLLALDGMPQLDFDDEVRALATQEGLDPEETVLAATELARGWEGS